MNIQPFSVPPRVWEPRISPRIMKLYRPAINRVLREQQRITELNYRGLDRVRALIASGAGVLFTPNHSFHYDSYVLIEGAHRIGRPLHILTAWQVFAMSSPYEQWMSQRHGAFSINREAVDPQAFKTSVEILCASPYPLVVFPEGDIYHCNDRVMPFRDGAAAIALGAARKGKRPIFCVPTALKCFYTSDPTIELQMLLDHLETLMQWRPRRESALANRIQLLATAMISLKELEYLGETRPGRPTRRAHDLAEEILTRLERKHSIQPRGDTAERVREIRRIVIREGQKPDITSDQRRLLGRELDDVFLVIQLISYPVQYLSVRPTIERLAETCDKFEEDLLRATYPKVRGTRRAEVEFGEPIPIPATRSPGVSVETLTKQVESAVQGLLDEINRRQVEAKG